MGAVELGVRLKVAFVKNVSAAISKNALWMGDLLKWKNRRGRARQGPYYKLMYGDFVSENQHLQIDWGGLPSKIIYNKINHFKNGGLINYKNLTYD